MVHFCMAHFKANYVLFLLYVNPAGYIAELIVFTGFKLGQYRTHN